jgi:hypothetical protein
MADPLMPTERVAGFRGVGKQSSLGDTLEAMKSSEVNAVVSAIASWALARDDVRALALAGSWARGNPHQASDVDLLLFTDNGWYRHRWKWLTEIDFERAGYSLHSSRNAMYGVVWSSAGLVMVTSRALTSGS